MLPVAAITGITHVDIDTVIIWDDGQRNVAYAYKGGRVIRTMPLEAGGLTNHGDEIRGAFRITDGTIHAIASTTPTEAPAIPSMQPAGAVTRGPSRWG